jgi:hypothetical protein
MLNDAALSNTKATDSDSRLIAQSITADGVVTGSVSTGDTQVIVTPSSGHYIQSLTIDLGSGFLPVNICTGTTIFGRAGSAMCNTGFGDRMASLAHRDVGATQISLSEELSAGLGTGYRAVPNTSKDDDGYYTMAAGCTGAGGPSQTCATVVRATRPSADCGTSGTIDDRIADCNTSNNSSATWDGAMNGIEGEGVWKLVTRIFDAARTYEVWRDERTKLLWSDRLGDLTTNTNQGVFNWCMASGNTEDSTNGVECTAGLNSASNINRPGVSLCYDDGVGPLTTPNGINNSTTAANLASWDSAGLTDSQQNDIIRAKGNLTSVSSRLPTRADFMQADLDGVTYVLPNSETYYFWSASIFSTDRRLAWIFTGGNGYMTTGTRSGSNIVRCVGR